MLLLKNYYTQKLGYRATLAQYSAELSIHINDHKQMAYEKRINSLNEAKANRIGPSIEQKLLYAERKENPNDCTEWTPVFSQFYQNHPK